MKIRRHDAVEFGRQKLGELEQRYGWPSHVFYTLHILGYSVIGDSFTEDYWASLYEVFLAAVEQQFLATARRGTSLTPAPGESEKVAGGSRPPSSVS